MNAPRHEPNDWTRKHHSFRPLTLRDSYMADEEAENDARMYRPRTLRQRWAMWRACRRQRRDFRAAMRNYHQQVHPMAEAGHSIVDSWYFLVPLGLMIIGILLWQAGVFA